MDLLRREDISKAEERGEEEEEAGADKLPKEKRESEEVIRGDNITDVMVTDKITDILVLLERKTRWKRDWRRLKREYMSCTGRKSPGVLTGRKLFGVSQALG